MARAIPSVAENTHGGEGRGESFVCARQSLQESSPISEGQQEEEPQQQQVQQ